MVTVSLTNTADAGGRYIRTLAVHAVRGREEVNVFADKPYVTRLEDGKTAPIDMFEWENDAPAMESGMEAGKTWTIKVTRSDLRDTVWDEGARRYTVFKEDVRLPSCRLTKVDRGYSKTQVTIQARDYWGAESDRRFRIRLVNKRGTTVHSRAVPMLTGTTKTVVLKKSDIPKRVWAKRVPALVVEQWDPNATYDTVGDGKPPSHWGQDFGGTGYDVPVWRAR